MVAVDWHLDKKVPIGLILGLVFQTIVLTAWGTSKFEDLTHRVDVLERTDKSTETHENRLIVLEQQFDYIRADLAEIKTLLQRRIPDEAGKTK